MSIAYIRLHRKFSRSLSLSPTSFYALNTDCNRIPKIYRHIELLAHTGIATHIGIGRTRIYLQYIQSMARDPIHMVARCSPLPFQNACMNVFPWNENACVPSFYCSTPLHFYTLSVLLLLCLYVAAVCL